ncbi:MAG: cyclic nucleotide-binding domain-containing protein [Candidatus Sericytochromatia bacterium]|nr:cyclic nucleotide-binding domain-containing protein [Candidatus Sericytochromatia bacterium]
MAFIGHLTFGLIALSYLVRDIFILRILSIIASLAGIIFNYYAPAEPLWLVINWNLAFIGVNLFQIGMSIYEKRKITFSAEQSELYETIFTAFSPIEFLKLMRLSTWHEASQGQKLTEEGKPLKQVMLIYSGEAGVEVSGKEVNRLKDGDFIGEMSFFTGTQATATVKTLSENTRYLSWDKTALSALMQRNPNLRFALQSILGNDLTRKLQRPAQPSL